MLSARKKLPTSDITDFVHNMIIPMFAIERTMVMPFDKQRHENVGEHSFSLAMLAGALAEHIDPDLDIGKITQYALVHDIAEIYTGDVTVWESD
jgi:5'-deoxynucleotidase YfbR-like HD superfamily hydrolase